MSPIENNLLDLQPQSLGKNPLDSAPSRSLVHYQRVDKQCISLQVLPHARPYVIPVAKTQTRDDLADVLATLPEIKAIAGSPAEVEQNIDGGRWRLIDEAGLLIRIQDWPDLVCAGAQIILDTNGTAKREAEKYGSEKVQAAPEPILPPAEGIQSSKWSTIHSTAAKPAPPNDDNLDLSQESTPDDVKPGPGGFAADEPQPAAHNQGDPEWMSWGGAAANDGPGWDVSSAVTPADDGWADQDDRSSSTPSFRRGPHKPINTKWHASQANSNPWNKNKFPPKVHLTFYAPFQLPRKYPLPPQIPYSRFSIDVSAAMWQVATRVFMRAPFDSMRPPPATNPEELDYIFLELRYTNMHGKSSLERGRERRIKGSVTLAELGLVVDGGEEGLGRYYFMIDDPFTDASGGLHERI